jgi:hypothetical protein
LDSFVSSPNTDSCLSDYDSGRGASFARARTDRFDAGAATGDGVLPRRKNLRSFLSQSRADAVANPISNAKSFSRSHDAVILVVDATDNVIETHEHKGDFKEW